MVEKSLHPHDLVEGAVGFPFGCGLKKGELPSPVLDHVDELNGLGRVNRALPAEPDVGVDVVGVVGDIQLVDGDGIKADRDHLGRGGRGALRVEGSFLDGAASVPPADRTRNIKRIKKESFISE